MSGGKIPSESSEVIKEYRRSLISWGKMPSESLEVKKGYQNGIGTPKILWFDTSHDLFLLILFSDHFWRSLSKGGQNIGRIYGSISAHDLCGSKKYENMSDELKINKLEKEKVVFSCIFLFMEVKMEVIFVDNHS